MLFLLWRTYSKKEKKTYGTVDSITDDLDRTGERNERGDTCSLELEESHRSENTNLDERLGQPRSRERADAFLSRKWSIGRRKAASLSRGAESNWPERIELVPGSRRGGQKEEVEDGLGARQDTRGRFLSLSFRSSRDHILEFRDARAVPSLFREVFILVRTSARGIADRPRPRIN